MRERFLKGAVISLLMLLSAFVGWNFPHQEQSVFAQSDLKFSYLSVQAGDATPTGGKEVIDMRNGNVWICDFRKCTPKGHYPFESIR